MDYSDVVEMAKTSKYAKDLTWTDPNVRAVMPKRSARRYRGEGGAITATRKPSGAMKKE